MHLPTMFPDLFDSAFVPNWSLVLNNLKELALPESWSFRNAPTEKLRRENMILERYVNAIFTSQVINAQSAASPYDADQFFLIRSGFACFNTGLLTKHYKPIFGYLERNGAGYDKYWRLKGFFDDTHPRMQHVEKLPLKPFFYLKPEEWGFSPNIPIRVNVDHILDKPENMLRIPEAIRGFPNLYMLLQTGVEMARRTVEFIPSLVVPQVYQNRVQYLLPICLTDPKSTDLVMTLSPKDGYYLGSTCLTPYMAYANARMLARPTAPWLATLVG